VFSCRCVSLAVVSVTVPVRYQTQPTGKHWHNLIPIACSHITYTGVRVMVYSVTSARTDKLPEDGHTVTKTCRRFYEILAF